MPTEPQHSYHPRTRKPRMDIIKLTDFQLFLIRALLKARREEGRFKNKSHRKQEDDLRRSIRNEMGSRGLTLDMDELHMGFNEPFSNIEGWAPLNYKP